MIGLLRFAMGISENIVAKSEVYEVEELSIDPTRTIQRSLLSKSTSDTNGAKLITYGHSDVVKQIAFDRHKDP